MTNSQRTLLLVLVGAPASGKSTWARKHFRRGEIVSLDQLRRAVSGDESNQDATPYVVPIANDLIRARLAFAQTTVVDATNFEEKVRREYWSIGCGYGATTGVVVFDTPLDVCLARNAMRPKRRRVPVEFIERTHAQILADMPEATTWIPRCSSFGVWVQPHRVVVGGFVPEPIRSMSWLDAARNEHGRLHTSMRGAA